MEIIEGIYNEAKCYAVTLEDTAREQIRTLCNQPYSKGSEIRIMPDAHAGAGCTIGTTMTITNTIVPNFVGVDIGCGMLVAKIKEKNIDLEKLDNIIREHIPYGFEVREVPHERYGEVDITNLKCFPQGQMKQRYVNSLGTLGGGNHFIELDKDEEDNLYLVLHSGSRNLGKQVATLYQNIAYEDVGGKSQKEYTHDLAYLSGQHMQDYLDDMRIMQKYADLNRHIMKDVILSNMNLTVDHEFTTIHNYIDLDAMILRKGAIFAGKGEKLIIPMNMRDGSLICEGLGNEDWNYSAPHGAGRIMSRRQAVDSLSLNAFEDAMKGIYTTCVSMETIDESPMAYKPANEIIRAIKDAVETKQIIKPIYNFKATETRPCWKNEKTIKIKNIIS